MCSTQARGSHLRRALGDPDKDMPMHVKRSLLPTRISHVTKSPLNMSHEQRSLLPTRISHVTKSPLTMTHEHYHNIAIISL